MSVDEIVARARQRVHESQLRIAAIESRNVLDALKQRAAAEQESA